MFLGPKACIPLWMWYNDSMNKRDQINVFPLLTIGYFFCGVLALAVIGTIVGEIFSQISKLMG